MIKIWAYFYPGVGLEGEQQTRKTIVKSMKLAKIILLCIFLSQHSCSSESVGSGSVLLAEVHYNDDVMTWSMPEADYSKLPSWDINNSPPVTVAEALKIISIRLKNNDYRLKSITLKGPVRGYSDAQKNIYHYFVELEMKNAGQDALPYFVVVLSSGEILEKDHNPVKDKLPTPSDKNPLQSGE